MSVLSCPSDFTFPVLSSGGVDYIIPQCAAGWSVLDPAAAGGSIDYVLSGQYFTAAFIVSASIIVSTVVIRTLLNFIRR